MSVRSRALKQYHRLGYQLPRRLRPRFWRMFRCSRKRKVPKHDMGLVAPMFPYGKAIHPVGLIMLWAWGVGGMKIAFLRPEAMKFLYLDRPFEWKDDGVAT